MPGTFSLTGAGGNPGKLTYDRSELGHFPICLVVLRADVVIVPCVHEIDPVSHTYPKTLPRGFGPAAGEAAPCGNPVDLFKGSSRLDVVKN